MLTPQTLTRRLKKRRRPKRRRRRIKRRKTSNELVKSSCHRINFLIWLIATNHYRGGLTDYSIPVS